MSRLLPRRREAWARGGLAVSSGLLMWLAFPPAGLWPLAPVGVAVLALLLRGRTWRAGAGLGFIAGLAFFLPLLEGIAAIGPDGWIVLSLIQALYFVPLGAGIAVVTRLRAWPLWVATLWVAEEFVRGRQPFGGFPWGRLAFSQATSPLGSYAAHGGAPLVSFIVALTGGLIAFAALTVWRLRNGDSTSVRRLAVITALPLAGVLALGAAGPLLPTQSGGGDGKKVTVAVVQGNVPRLGLDAFGQSKAVLNNHARQTHELARRVREEGLDRPDLVIWPENASDLDPYADADARETIDAAVRDVGVPVLVGAVVDAADGEHRENRGIVWDPRTGPGNYYVKRHPVPFGEYLPFRKPLTKLVSRFEQIPKDFAKGKRSGEMQLGPATVGDVICFEVAYDGVVRDVAGAGVLVVQTNNATYGKTSLPPQQLAMSRLRAVEHDRAVLVAATSGISAIVAPDGRLVDKSAEFVPDIQVAQVSVRTSRTLADHLGAWPEWALALLGAAAVVFAVRRGGRGEGTRP